MVCWHFSWVEQVKPGFCLLIFYVAAGLQHVDPWYPLVGGLGNWLSDTIGLGLGDVIERTAGKMGLSNGNLSPAQELGALDDGWIAMQQDILN